jgi:hypothetical protein
MTYYVKTACFLSSIDRVILFCPCLPRDVRFARFDINVTSEVKGDNNRSISYVLQFRSEYKSSPDPMKENYLLSVFLGDVIASPKLCHLLAKRGRSCDNATLPG